MSETTSRTGDINAIDNLRSVRAIAEKLRESAEEYLSQIESSARPDVEPGNFYLTYDGSLAFVLRRYTKCQCAQCTGKMTFAGLLGFVLVQTAESNVEDAVPAHEASADETPVTFIATLLKGGHSIKEIAGEKPGDQYIVDASGLAIIGCGNNSGRQVISRVDLGIAGLSFRKRLLAKFEEATA